MWKCSMSTHISLAKIELIRASLPGEAHKTHTEGSRTNYPHLIAVHRQNKRNRDKIAHVCHLDCDTCVILSSSRRLRIACNRQQRMGQFRGIFSLIIIIPLWMAAAFPFAQWCSPHFAIAFWWLVYSQCLAAICSEGTSFNGTAFLSLLCSFQRITGRMLWLFLHFFLIQRQSSSFHCALEWQSILARFLSVRLVAWCNWLSNFSGRDKWPPFVFLNRVQHETIFMLCDARLSSPQSRKLISNK